MPHTLFIIDDCAVFRDSLCELLRHHGFHICGIAADGISALSLIAQLRPDIVLCDITMPGMNGITLMQVIRTCAPLTGVIALSIHTDATTIHAAEAAGAHVYVMKGALFDKLIPAIHHVAATHRSEMPRPLPSSSSDMSERRRQPRKHHHDS
jgi:DNA-binding NarL/FixJ family response regulator